MATTTREKRALGVGLPVNREEGADHHAVEDRQDVDYEPHVVAVELVERHQQPREALVVLDQAPGEGVPPGVHVRRELDRRPREVEYLRLLALEEDRVVGRPVQHPDVEADRDGDEEEEGAVREEGRSLPRLREELLRLGDHGIQGVELLHGALLQPHEKVVEEERGIPRQPVLAVDVGQVRPEADILRRCRARGLERLQVVERLAVLGVIRDQLRLHGAAGRRARRRQVSPFFKMRFPGTTSGVLHFSTLHMAEA
jgi:hypothetical protein